MNVTSRSIHINLHIINEAYIYIYIKKIGKIVESEAIDDVNA